MSAKVDDKKNDTPELMGDEEFGLAFDANIANEGKTLEEIAEAEKLAANEGKTPEEIAEAEKLAANEGKTPEEIAEAEKLAANEGKTPEEIAEAEKLAAAKVDPTVAAAKKVITDAAQKIKDDDEKKVADAAAKKTADEAKVLAEQNKKDLEHTDGEKESLKVLKKDWKDIDTALAAKERVMLVTMKQEIAKGIAAGLATVRAEFSQAIAPLASSTAETAKDRFAVEVKATHTDAYELLPEIEKWVETQPSFMQPGYNKVLDGGTAAETIALVTIFKDATGRTEVAKVDDKVVDEAAVAEARAAKEAERKKKLESLGGVTGKSSVKTASVDEDDFNGAFEEAAAIK